MGATVAVILQPTPGKQQQLQAHIAVATRILESTGGHVRTWQAIFAGPQAGRFYSPAPCPIWAPSPPLSRSCRPAASGSSSRPRRVPTVTPRC